MPADPTPASRPPADPTPGVEAWMNSPQFRDMMRDEFPEDASEWLDPVSRRAFLSLSAAGVALAVGAGCNPSFKAASQRKVVPYVKQPEHIRPGIPLFFATAMPQHGGVGLGLIVKQSEGRPLKTEGNPQHPSSLGKNNLSALASTLDFYDPDRSQKSVKGDARAPGTFEQAVADVRTALTKASATQGEGVRVLTAPSTSPTVQRLMEKFLARFPKAAWLQYEPVTRDNLRKATKVAFGRALNPVYDFKAADVVLSLDADFLTVGPGAVRYANDFGSRRVVSTIHALEEEHNHDDAAANATKHLNRLYVVEGMPTSTGAIADHRLPLKPSLVEAFARELAHKLGVKDVASTAADLPELAKKWVAALVKDLKTDDAGKSRAGKAVVIAGEQASAATHLLALLINENIGAITPQEVKNEKGEVVKDDKGQPKKLPPLVTFTDPLEAVKRSAGGGPRDTLAGWPTDDQIGSLGQLAKDMLAGKVDVLLMSGVNPLYDAPADLKFAEAIDKVRAKGGSLTLHHGLYQDETAARCGWHLNAAHYLESWGDVRAHDGTVSVIQPLIAPLYGGKTLVEFLAAVLEEAPSDGLAVVRATYPGMSEKAWEVGLKDGVFADSAFKPVADAFKPADAVKSLDADGFSVKPIKDLEIAFRPDPVLFDGQQANNGWLQELPKPITNLCWDNAAMVSPRTAEELKIQHGYTFNTYRSGERGCTETDIVTLVVGGRKLNVAVHVLTGHADGVVTLHLGYGRRRSGRVASPAEGTTDGMTGFDGNTSVNDSGRGVPGFDAYQLRGTQGLWTAKLDDKPSRTNARFFLAVAGAHAAMESRRPVRFASKAQFINDEEFAKVPPVAAADTELLVANTPGTVANFKKQGLKHPHDHGHDHHGHDHDKRIVPLNLYHDNPIKVNGKDANTSYRRWAMSIDLGACIGCSACTLACVAENNIPVVGKEQVHRGRAMHWIRIDRYYTLPKPGKLMSDEYGAFGVSEEQRKKLTVERGDDLQVHVQPVPCQQCEKAPCEVVCPVAATVHSADGLNDMVYNRCVGTRYCSNNCPYKVRRFNFLQYTDYTTDSLKLLNNPEVTVRSRGVMEKCTYCVQRIRFAEVEAEREWAARTGPVFDTHGHPVMIGVEDERGRPVMEVDAEGKPVMADELGKDGKPVLNADGTPKKKAKQKQKPMRKPTEDRFGRPKILDGDVMTACQQACPTGAIKFGDLSDDGRDKDGQQVAPPADILTWKAEPHSYGLLAELNTMPRTTYLAAIKNPNPALEAATHGKGA